MTYGRLATIVLCMLPGRENMSLGILEADQTAYNGKCNVSLDT
jgi:hypothetical protein